jgi:hypothetical protein
VHLWATHVPDDQPGDDGDKRQLDVQGAARPLVEMGGEWDAGAIRTAIAASVPQPKRRAIARRRSRSPAARSDGTTAATSNSCPPTKNAIASKCR